MSMTADDCLRIVATHLPGSRLEGRFLYVGEQLVATATLDRKAVLVRHATCFDGHQHYTPDGCDTHATAVRYHRDPVGRVLRAIEERQAARAKSLPMPVSEGGYDPERSAA